MILFLVATNVGAEEVSVKYFGNVDLEKYSCNYVSSSVVNRICFNEKNQSLILLLKNTYYAYCRVPKEVINQLSMSPSIGKYYNEFIRGHYDCR